MFNFNDLVSNLLLEAVPPVSFDPDYNFQAQIQNLILKFYQGEPVDKIFQVQFTENAIRLVSSGYGTISDEQLKSVKKYWPIIDFGYAILSEIGVNATGKEKFRKLKTGVLTDYVKDVDTVKEITEMYNTVYAYKSVIDYKEFMNYRLRELAGPSSSPWKNALAAAAKVSNAFPL